MKPSDLISLHWQLTFRDFESGPDHQWVPATVPGAVQRDWGLATGMPDPHFGDGYKAYGWMEDVWWVYRAELPELSSPSTGQRFFFFAEGIDYRFSIWLGDQCLLQQEGMFTPVRLDLGEAPAAGDVLEIRIAPVPKADDSGTRNQARNSCKPACSYGWDWHPRLVPSGIWRPCGIIMEFPASLRDVTVMPSLDADFAMSRVFVRTEVSTPAHLHVEIFNPVGITLVRGETEHPDQGLELTVTNPALWWPNGQGEPTLYTCQIRLLDASGRLIDSVHRTIGFRTIRLVMNEGAWDSPTGFPKSRSAAPATVEINGRRIFAKGTNWIPPRMFPGEITDDDYTTLLALAKDAHFNLVRVWGGGVVNSAAFFEECDRLGLMVIQEFPLACNNYPDDVDYLAVLDRESHSIISALRHHPSLVIWSGGNELFNSWSGMTDQSHALRLLNKNCYELDRSRPFLATMPVEGMGHGPYSFIEPLHHHDIFHILREDAGRTTAMTEFGQAGVSDLACLQSMMPAGELWPPMAGTGWESHHGIAAFYQESWLGKNILDHIFGPAANLEELIDQSQWLQAVGYQMIYETTRRNWPRCSMAINWCFNDVWPSAVNNSLLAWPATPKAAYFAVRDSCRPRLLSAELDRIAWQPEEEFACQLWLLNDSPIPTPDGQARASLTCGTESLLLGEWQFSDTPAHTNVQGPRLAATIPADWASGEMRLMLDADDPALCHSYRLALGRSGSPLAFSENLVQMVLNQ